MAKASTRAITSKRAIPIEPDALAALNAHLEEKKWTRDRLLEMLAHFFTWYDSPERGEAWRPIATPRSSSKLHAAYLEEAREYMERIEQELMREHLVAEAAILHNATLRYVRDHLPSGSQEREKAVTVVVYLPRELDDIIQLMKGMKHLDTYSTFYEEAARFWFAARLERELESRDEGEVGEGYTYIEPVTAALLARFPERGEAYTRRALTFSRSTYDRISAIAALDAVNINNVGLQIILDHMEHLEREGELERYRQLLEASSSGEEP